MSYFRQLPNIRAMLDLFLRDESWLIVINADPDAMASAMALKRIMSRRVRDIAIAKINALTRPDNLAMVRYTRLHMQDYKQSMCDSYQRFAIVDSQPHHSPLFANIPFSIIIDHHPLPDNPFVAPYCEIRPEYGATSTLMTEHMYNLGIVPGKLLATALQFGIKTDTNNFERHFFDVDIRAYQYLFRHSDHALLSRIARNEYRQSWLSYLIKAFSAMYPVKTGQYIFLGSVDNPDILVSVADLLMQVLEIRWAVVAGIYKKNAIVIFRSDGISRNVGSYASCVFGDIASAGGHKDMARAELPLSVMAGEEPELFIYRRLLLPVHERKKKDA